MRGTALTVHIFAAKSANEFSFQKEISPNASGADLVFCQNCFYVVKQLFRNDCGKNIIIDAFIVSADTDVFFKAQHLVDSVHCKRSSSIGNAFFSKVLQNLFYGNPLGVVLKDLPDNRGLIFFDINFFLFYIIPVRNDAS